jgi:hypothetical protein
VNIDNNTFFLNTSGTLRDDSKRMYESLNMPMISIEGDLHKWRTVNKWLKENGKNI